MRRLLPITALLSCAVFLLGCPLLKKKGDDAEAGAEAGAVAADEAGAAPEADAAPPPAPEDAAAPAPIAVNAKNAADVARFPGETAVGDDDMKLARAATVRTAPKTGASVATLQPNQDPHKIAEYQDSVLVQFPDPKDKSTNLMGWIGKESFTVLKVRVTDGGVVTDAAAPKVDAAAPPPVVVVDAGGGIVKVCATE